MRQRVGVLWFLLAALLFPGGAACAAEAAEVTVNGIGIPKSRVDVAVENNVKQGQPNTPELRKRVLDALITQEIIAQAALAQGLDKDPLLAGSLDLLRQEVLINVLLVDYLNANPVSDEMLRAEYDKLKPLQPTREYKIRHIMVGTQEQAAQLIAQLRKGASFEKLAAEHSADTPSRSQGGDLGWVTLDRLVAPIAEAVAKLQKGQFTEAPVRAETGWHIVRLDEERPAAVPTFDEAKPRLQQIVQNRIAQQLISDLRTKAKVE
jgi:peptidyl-prolyl cis-trans isomerase C